MSDEKLTKWEAGNVIVKAADSISESVLELKDFPEIRDELITIRKKISEIYTSNGFTEEMGFGI